ncbi:MAG: Fic family protein [Oscillatoriaceae cyanobacterium Prado104]|jgi:Fic family protein|nr:Fic family protein [Oscillatoriaceae cyanobacterium Prado104]
MKFVSNTQPALAHQLYDDLMAILVRLYPQRLGEILHQHSHYLLNNLMSEFIQWLNSANITSLHPLEYAAEAHLRFVSIHPFRDGNGRTGRLLINLLLLPAGYPIAVISNQVRAAYIDAIAQAQQQNAGIDPLLDLIVDAARDSLIETLQILATASDSRGRGLPFYEEMLAVLQQHSECSSL